LKGSVVVAGHFHDAAVHDRHPVADVFHHAGVVGYEKESEIDSSGVLQEFRIWARMDTSSADASSSPDDHRDIPLPPPHRAGDADPHRWPATIRGDTVPGGRK
jgi:hypothetical protein